MENQLLSLKDYVLSTRNRKIICAFSLLFFVFNIILTGFISPYILYSEGKIELETFVSDIIFLGLIISLLIFISNVAFIDNKESKSLFFHIKKLYNSDCGFEHFFATVLIMSIIYIFFKVLFGAFLSFISLFILLA